MPIIVTRKSLTPEYVDAVVPQAGLRRRLRVAGKREPQFARAYLRLIRGLIDGDTADALRRAIDRVYDGRMTIDEAVDVIEWYNPADPLASKKWMMLAEGLNRFYLETAEEAGAGEMRARGFPIKFTVQKAGRIGAVIVPVNPYTAAWAENRSGELIVDINDQQRELVRRLIEEKIGQSLRSKDVLEEIERTVGLTDREWWFVANREDLLRKQGWDLDSIRAAVDKYTKKLLRARAKRIARTETVFAYSAGLEDSWQMAADEGFVENPLKEWVELTDSPRTCKVCRGLAGQRVPVNQPFISEIAGEIMRPPAHPHCRCTMFLVDEEDIAAGPVTAEGLYPTTDANAPIRQADLDAMQAREQMAGG